MVDIHDDLGLEMQGDYQNAMDSFDETLSKYNKFRQEKKAGVTPQPGAAAPQEGAKPAPKELPENPTFWDKAEHYVWDDGVKQVIGGGIDAIKEVNDTIQDIYDWGTQNIDMLKGLGGANLDIADAMLPNIAESDGTGGQLIRGAAQFLTAFIPATGALKALGLGNKLVQAMAAGAAVDFSAFDPLQSRLSNWAKEAGISTQLTDYLAADANDTALEGRFKNAVEGIGIGALTEGIFKAARVMKGVTKSKEVVTKTGAEVAAEKAAQQKTLMEAKAELQVVREVPKDFMVAQKHNFGFTKDAEGAAKLAKVRDEFLAGKSMDKLDYIGEHMKHVETPEEAINVMKLLSDGLMDSDKAPRNLKLVQESAAVMGMNLDEATRIAMDTGTSMRSMDARILAARELSAKLSLKVDEIAKKINGGLSTDADLVRLDSLMESLATVSHAKDTAIREWGRAGRAQRIKVNGEGLARMTRGELEELSAQLKQNSGSFAKRWSMLTDEYQRNALVRKGLANHSGWDVPFHVWVNSILSGPATHVNNIAMNIAFHVTDLGETAIAATKNMLSGGGEVTWAEFGTRVGSIFTSFFDGLKVAKTALKDGESALRGKTKFDYTPLSGATIGKDGLMGKFTDGLIKLTGIPSKMLVGADEFFRFMAQRGEINAQALRYARKKGLSKGDVFKEFVEKFENNKSMDRLTREERVIKQAVAQKGDYLTFTEQLGPTGQALLNTIKKTPGLRYAIPFVTTPMNLMKNVGRRTPGLAKYMREVADDLAAGGARAEMAKARMNMGQLFIGVGGVLAANGYLTGGADKSNRDRNYLIDRQPYSIKIGDKWVAFNKADPFGAFLGVCADMTELAPQMSDADFGELMGAAVTMISRNILSKTYLKGLTDALMAASDPQRYGESWIQNAASSFVPYSSLMNQLNRGLLDNDIREVDGLITTIQKKMPWVSQGLPPKRHAVTGAPITYGEGGLGGLNPYYARTESQDPVLQEMYRIGFTPGDMPKSLLIGGKRGPLSLKDYDQLQQMVTQYRNGAGRTMHEQMAYIIQTPGYQRADNDEKKDILDRVKTQYRRAGKRLFQRTRPDIVEQIKNLRG